LPLAGQPIRASDIPVLGFEKKVGGESVTSLIVPQDDDDLQVTLSPGTYRVTLILAVTGAAAGDLRVMWATTGTMTILGRSCWGPSTAATDITNTAMVSRGATVSTQVGYGTDGTSIASAVMEDLLVDVSVEGVLRMQWAQVSSSGTATVLSTSSRMFVTPVTAI
jgi:hypothetical protein